MDSQRALETIKAGGIVAGMRGAFPPDVALQVSDTLMSEGINAFELMMNSQEPIAAMQALKAEYGEGACVGMGTVLDVETAHEVIDAGADFVVSPAFQPDVVRAVLSRDVLIGPGVATPSEAVAAWDMGVKLLKLFPIGALGIEYYRAMFGPAEAHDLYVQRRHRRSKRARIHSSRRSGLRHGRLAGRRRRLVQVAVAQPGAHLAECGGVGAIWIGGWARMTVILSILTAIHMSASAAPRA